MPLNPYYIEKTAGYSTKINDLLVTPVLYQPTPEGVIELCDHYSKKYNIDLICVDLRDRVARGDKHDLFFTYLKKHPSILEVEEGKARGLILSYGQYHVIPVWVFLQEGVQHMVVFDSSSGGRMQGYYKVAELFPNAWVYLNAGTRQADEGSCMTDAICILKEALQIEGLLQIIQHKRWIEHRAYSPTKFQIQSKPENFYVFKMPEQLLLTAQVSRYLTDADADLNVIVRGGKSLGFYRTEYNIQASLFKDSDTKRTNVNVNSYLYIKGKEHKVILDARWEKNKVLQQDEFDEFEQELDFDPSSPNKASATSGGHDSNFAVRDLFSR